MLAILTRLSSLCYLGIFLHTVVLGVHIALLVLWKHDGLRRFTFDIGPSTDNATHIVTEVQQILATVLTVIMVYISQRLSMVNIFRNKRVLTIAHDMSEAWSGLGAAVGGLISQRDVPSSPVQISLVLIYLGAISVLHITAPALVFLQTYNSTETSNITVMGFPDYLRGSAADFGLSVPPIPGELGIDAMPTLFRMNTSLPGIQGRVLYDIPTSNSANTPLGVGALKFDVTCGSGLPSAGVEFIDTESPMLDGSGVHFQSTVTISDLYNIKVLSGGSVPEQQGNLSVLTALKIQDSQGHDIGAGFQYPSMNATKTPHPYNSSFFYMLTCELNITSGTVMIDPQTKLMSSSDLFNSIGNSSSKADVNRTSVISSMESIWAFNLPLSNTVPLESSAQACGVPQAVPEPLDTSTCTISLTKIEQYIMTLSGLSSTNEVQTFSPIAQQTVSVNQIENALSNIAAGAIWGDMFFNDRDVTREAFLQVRFQSSLEGINSVQKSKLAVSPIQTIIGLVASLILFFISIYVTIPHLLKSQARRPQANVNEIERENINNDNKDASKNEFQSFGILQTIWMAAQRPDRLADFMNRLHSLSPDGPPSLSNLRGAGMMEFSFSPVAKDDGSQGINEWSQAPLLKHGNRYDGESIPELEHGGVVSGRRMSMGNDGTELK